MSIMAKTPSGYKKIGSAYLGERPVDKVFNANGDVVYALQRELTGVPPLLFKGKEQSELLNYRICGNTETKQRDYSGSSPLTVPVHDGELYNYRIYGNTVNGESVGDRTGNLCGINGTIAFSNDVSVKSKDGEFIIQSNGINNTISAKSLQYQNKFKLHLTAGTYTYSYRYNGMSVGIVMGVYTIEGEPLNSNFTLLNDTDVYIGFYIPPNTTCNQRWMAMLNTGSTPLPYEPYGYKVPIAVTNSGTTSNETIYLPEPIKMVGSEAEYVDYYSQKQYFADGTNTAVTIPALPISTGTNTVTVNTTVQPSNVEVSIDENVSVGDLVTSGQHAGEYKVPVTVEGKNLFSSRIEQGSFDGITGVPNNSSTRVRSHEDDYIFLTPGVYKISAMGVEHLVVYAYDLPDTNAFNYNLSRTNWAPLPSTITVNTSAYYKFGFCKTNNPNITPSDISNIMLNAGSDALPYEPYHAPVTTPIYLPEQIKMEAHQADFVDYAKQTFQTRKVVYGWHVDPTISDSFNAVTYLEDAAGMTPAAMGASTFSYGSWKNAFFMPKPCMLKSDGTVDYYLNPNDYTKKADGTPSDVANSDYDGNAMMEWSKIWYKFAGTEIDGEGYFYVSNYKVDDTYHCWCNIDSENNETDHFYTAIYNGTGTTKLRSISGIPLTSANGNGGTNVTREVTRAIANNTTSAVEWYTEVFSDKLLINALLVLMGKSLNTQATFGRGLDTGKQTVKEAYITGTLNDKGLFWGVTANGNSAVKVFGMENWWGCVWRRVAGCISVNNALKVKLTYGTADGSAANGYNQTGNGYIDNGNIPTSNNFVKTMSYNELGYSPSSVTGSSSTTFYGDYFYQNTDTTYLLFGGSSAAGVNAGAFYFDLSYTPNGAYWHLAAALSCKPLAGKNPTPDSIRSITLPALPTIKGTNTMSIDTEVQPSRMDIKGRIKTLT